MRFSGWPVCYRLPRVSFRLKNPWICKNLVSLNADVYFRLKSDYAKSFWPFIELCSQPTPTFRLSAIWSLPVACQSGDVRSWGRAA